MAADAPEREERAPGGTRKRRASTSARKRTRTKTLREELLAALADADAQKQVSAALIREAIEGNRSGSVTRAFEILRDTIGEKPTDKPRPPEMGDGDWPFAEIPTRELRKMVEGTGKTKKRKNDE
jgi:hypothetical protein